MKTHINTNLFKLEDVLEILNHSIIFQKLINLDDVYSRLELDRRLLMFNFEDNDVEVQQLIDAIELQQYYVDRNIEILREALTIKEKVLIIKEETFGIISIIGLN